MPITLVLADDHPLILDGMENLFRAEDDFKILARCLDGMEALLAVREHKPDILILDLRMPGKGGLEVLRAMKEEGHPTRVVVLTGAVDEVEVAEAIRLGARGLVLKELAPKLLVQCIPPTAESPCLGGQGDHARGDASVIGIIGVLPQG